MNKENVSVICVMVTYNRLELLKEAISAVKEQTYPVSEILIVDNKSTDGTGKYLSELAAHDKYVRVISMERNVGGSGGFSEGIKQAAKMKPDWIWIMDDDTIPQPDALEQMIPYTKIKKIGYLCSKVVWTDNNVHVMNKPGVCENQEQSLQNCFEGSNLTSDGVVAIFGASFVSLLLRGDVPYKVGLPYKEFFIWDDDAEYTKRIYDKGYSALMVLKSVAVHKTKANYFSSLEVIPSFAAWKLVYGLRNRSFLRRKRKGSLAFYFSQVNVFRRYSRKIKKRHLPKDEERVLLKAVRLGLWKGFFFNPKIEYLE